MTKANDKSGESLCKSKNKKSTNSQHKTERYIKVNETYYDYRTKGQSPHSPCRSIPQIQMKGQWLKQAGFDIDTPIKVRVMNGCLVVTVEERATE